MNKILNYVVTVLSVVALGLSIFCMTKIMQIPDPGQKDIQYVLYLGTNDKDTNEPVFPQEEAKEQLKKILIHRFGGYTITDANGGWVGEDEKRKKRQTDPGQCLIPESRQERYDTVFPTDCKKAFARIGVII